MNAVKLLVFFLFTTLLVSPMQGTQPTNPFANNAYLDVIGTGELTLVTFVLPVQ